MTEASGTHIDGVIDTSKVPRFGPRPSFDNGATGHKTRASQINGLRFQRKVEEACRVPETLALRTAHSYNEVMCGPWIYYHTVEGKERYSQPDVLLFNHASKVLTII